MTWFDIVKSDSKKEILEGLSILQQNIKPDMLEPRGGHKISYSGNVEREYVLTLDKNFDNFYFGNMYFIIQDTDLSRSEIKDRVVSFIKGLNSGDLKIDRYTTEKWTSTSKDRIVFMKGIGKDRSMLTIAMEKME